MWVTDRSLHRGSYRYVSLSRKNVPRKEYLGGRCQPVPRRKVIREQADRVSQKDVIARVALIVMNDLASAKANHTRRNL